jgi:DNA-binding GntR family transcriptional regulator
VTTGAQISESIVNRDADVSASAADSLDNVQIVRARIRDAIITGELQPGDEISQVRLAKTLGVSRTPLREALRMLQCDRLVESRPHRMVRVAPLSVQDAESVYAARITLESFSARITIPLLTDADLGTLQDDLVVMEDTCRRHDYAGLMEPHSRFHRALTRRGGAQIQTLLAQLGEHAERYRRKYTLESPESWTVGMQDHFAIFEAARARDGGAAAMRLAEHLARTAFRVIELIEPNYNPRALRVAVACARAHPAEET